MKKLDYHLISDTQGVKDLCDKANAKGIVGLDTEFMREKVYFAELCLLQIAIADEYFLVDTLALMQDAEANRALADLLANSDIVKIIHSCSQDIEVLSQYFQVVPQGVFDTQLAAGFCGYDGQLGYANLVHSVCSVELDKSQTRTNWQQRPLSSKQLEYAVNDVVYLQTLYEKFVIELQQRDRHEWFSVESKSIIQSAIDNHNPELAYQRLNGSNMPIKKQLFLVYLAVLRETIAQESNRPRPWILKDADLYTVAHAFPSSHQALFGLGIKSGFLRRNADQILDFTQSTNADQAAIWMSSQPLNPEQKNQVKQISKTLNQVAEHAGVARSIIANRKDIESFVSGRGARFEHGWRAELLGDSLASLVA